MGGQYGHDGYFDNYHIVLRNNIHNVHPMGQTLTNIHLKKTKEDCDMQLKAAQNQTKPGNINIFLS